MKTLRLIGLVGLTAVGAVAQNTYMDEGLASEVLKSTLNRRSAGAILNTPQLNKTYETLELEQALAIEAGRRGLGERVDVQQDLIRSRRKILIHALREDIARTVEAPSDKDLKKFYRDTKDQWTIPESYQIDAIQLDPENKSNLRRAGSLVTGEPISDDVWAQVEGQPVATQASGRWLTAADMSARIWDALPMMKFGSVRLFVIGDSRLLVRKGAHREPRVLEFEEVRDRVSVLARRQTSEEAWQDYLMNMRGELGLDGD